MARQPEPWKTLRDEFRKLQDQIRRMQAASPFFGTGMHPNGNGGIDSDNFVAGLSGYSFGNDGDAEFNELTLRSGIVGNDALTSPVVPGIAREGATNFALTAGTLQEKAGTDLVVPAGCTRLLATVTGRLYAVNTHTAGGADGTGTDALYVALKLGSGSATLATPTGISGNGGFATTTAAESYSLDSLTPDSTLRLGVYGACGYVNFAAHVDNRASYAATLIWLR